MFEKGELPSLWLQANVTPLYKKGSNTDPSNYRPVSLTSVVCKVMERIIRDRLMSHLTSNNLLTKRQHGFRSRKACSTNLLETMDYCTKTLSINQWLDIIFLDFAKAFDKVSHRKLLHKLTGYGITGKLAIWIAAFLKGRKQRVVLGNHYSQWNDVESGVPQGSVLGPVLFIIFIDDLAELISCVGKMYADDTKVMCGLNRSNPIPDIKNLQDDIDCIMKWTQIWGMQLNIKKCKVMHIGKSNPKHTYSMLDNETGLRFPLEETVCERDLGILVSNDLKPSCQVNHAASTANKVLGMLKNTFVNRDAKIWKKLYTCYVRPHLEFAVSAWSPYMQKDINCLEKVQKRATKSIHELRGLPYAHRCHRLGLTSLSERRVRGDLIQQFKFIRDKDEINWHFKPLKMPPRADRREQIKREIVRCCNQRHNFFNNRIVNYWNALSDDIVNSESVNQFKNKYDHHVKTAIGRHLH